MTRFSMMQMITAVVVISFLLAGSVNAQKIFIAFSDKEKTFSRYLHEYFQRHKTSAELENWSSQYGSIRHHKMEDFFSNGGKEKGWSTLHYSYGKGDSGHWSKGTKATKAKGSKSKGLHYSYGKGERGYWSKGMKATKAKGIKSKGSSAKGKNYYGSKSTKTNAKEKGGGKHSKNNGKGRGKGSFRKKGNKGKEKGREVSSPQLLLHSLQ